MIKTYYLVTKPGIIVGNAITVAGGFALGSRGSFNPLLFLVTMIGLSLVIASACVFNNCIDRHADQKMMRTKNRPLATGVITVGQAILFASILGIMGLSVLAVYTNLLTVSIAAMGFIIYVFLYSFWKYRTTYATEIGSFAGGVPPVVGYCAASGQFDLGALLLFLVVAFWQMPHFFSIAMYRFSDYSAASIPVLPIKKGMQATKKRMMLYIIAFILATLSLTAMGYTGYNYLVVSSILGVAWLFLCIKGLRSENDALWARNMFRLSLLIILVLSVMISVDVVTLPL